MISAIVPTVSGAARLARNLPSVARSLAAVGEPWEIVVVDDGGGSLGPLPDGARLLVRAENSGYGPAVNDGAAAAAGDYLLVLNDDVRLEDETVRRLRGAFPDPTLFAAVPTIRSPLAECGDEGGRGARWEAGLYRLTEAPSRQPHPSFYPVGCCFVCRRDAFVDLGGYDPLYAPFLWEDVDLGYRAWRRGLRTLHLPEAVCHHEGSATLGERHSLPERERVSFRNAVLFHLRNLQEPRRRAENLGAWAAYALLEPRGERQEGLAAALRRYREVGPRADGGLTDSEILARVVGE